MSVIIQEYHISCKYRMKKKPNFLYMKNSLSYSIVKKKKIGKTTHKKNLNSVV